MSRGTKFRIAIFVIVTLGVTGGVLLVTRDWGTPDPTMDAIERGLELERHEQLLARIAEEDSVLNDFTTDGCSGGLSIAWEEFSERFPEFAVRHGELPPWQDCCVTHDRQYHAGGTGNLSATESFELRKLADLDLKACVVNTGVERSSAIKGIYGLTGDQVRVLYGALSELMYHAVRVGGIPCTDQPWRWGYGWPLCQQEPGS